MKPESTIINTTIANSEIWFREGLFLQLYMVRLDLWGTSFHVRRQKLFIEENPVDSRERVGSAALLGSLLIAGPVSPP